MGLLHNDSSLSFGLVHDYIVGSIASRALLRASAGYYEETILEELHTLLIFAAKDLRFPSLQ